MTIKEANLLLQLLWNQLEMMTTPKATTRAQSIRALFAASDNYEKFTAAGFNPDDLIDQFDKAAKNAERPNFSALKATPAPSNDAKPKYPHPMFAPEGRGKRPNHCETCKHDIAVGSAIWCWQIADKTTLYYHPNPECFPKGHEAYMASLDKWIAYTNEQNKPDDCNFFIN